MLLSRAIAAKRRALSPSDEKNCAARMVLKPRFIEYLPCATLWKAEPLHYKMVKLDYFISYKLKSGYAIRFNCLV